MLRMMSTEQFPRSMLALGGSERLRRGAIVIVVAFGLLSMHGLTTGSTGTASHHGIDTAMLVHTATLADHAEDTVSSDGDSVRSTQRGHNDMHAIGEACLWLIVGGALLFFLRRVATRLVEFTHRHDQQRLEPPRWATLPRPPDPHVATVALRC